MKSGSLSRKTFARVDGWSRQYALQNVWQAIERYDAAMAVRVAIGAALTKALREIPYQTIRRESSNRHREMVVAALDAAIGELNSLKASVE
jgi:hypothetical protein